MHSLSNTLFSEEVKSSRKGYEEYQILDKSSTSKIMTCWVHLGGRIKKDHATVMATLPTGETMTLVRRFQPFWKSFRRQYKDIFVDGKYFAHTETVLFGRTQIVINNKLVKCYSRREGGRIFESELGVRFEIVSRGFFKKNIVRINYSDDFYNKYFALMPIFLYQLEREYSWG